jgi:hypothetical protein
MAVAYYDAIAKYLARRGAHVGYDVVAEPTEPVVAGDAANYTIRVRNKGTETLRDWRLDVNAVGAPARYVGRTGRGQLVGQAHIPRLAPGASTEVEIEVATPAPAREWMLVFDARTQERKRASELGSPPLQVRLTTEAPEPAPSTSTSPAPSPQVTAEP